MRSSSKLIRSGSAVRGVGAKYAPPRLCAATHARRAGLLTSAVVAMQRAALDGLVDRLDEHAVLSIGDSSSPSSTARSSRRKYVLIVDV